MLLYMGRVCIRYTISGKQARSDHITDPCTPSIYVWMHLCVCMRMTMCVFEGVCLYFSVRVYTLSARGHLDWVCVVHSGESTHMCLHEDLALCGCVFDKLWEHVGECLSIHLGESKREKEQNEEVEEICVQPLSSSQSAHSHTDLYLSLRQRGGRQSRERLTETRRSRRINMFKMKSNGEVKTREWFIQADFFLMQWIFRK